MTIDFANAIREAGLQPPDFIKPGEIHRFAGRDKKPSNKAGWCRLFDDSHGGVYGDFSTGLEATWQAHREKPYSAIEIKQFRQKVSKAKADHQKKQSKAAQKAQKIWGQSVSATADHPYLLRKSISPNGIRCYKNCLIIPLDDGNTIRSLQYIMPDGKKIFLTEGRTQGCYYIIGTPTDTLYVCEGLATAASIHEATRVATAVAFTANNLKAVAESLRGKHDNIKVIIAGDFDETGVGQKFATEAAEAINGSVAIPPEVGDWNDYATKHGLTTARKCLENLERQVHGSIRIDAEMNGVENSLEDVGKASTATKLVEIAQAEFDLGISVTGEGFAIPKDGPQLVSMLRSNDSLSSLLALTFFRSYGRATSLSALNDAMKILGGLAQEAEPSELHLRVGKHNSQIVLDLGDSTGRAVIIADGSWYIDDSPVLFRRTALSSALPEPQLGGDIDELFRFLNVTEADRPLLIAWLVSCFFPDISHPFLALQGEQGSGKSIASKLLIQLIDPSPVPVRKPPRDSEAWVTAAAASWVVAIDNLSSIPPWLSDSICRAVTGDGDIRRQLYTDGDVVVFSFRRCMILNGIDLGATRGDLSERMIPIHLAPIAEDKRLYESEMLSEWVLAQPTILGALLDVVARVASQVSEVSLPSRPRMADFARILAVVDEIYGSEGLAHYLEKQNTLAADSLTGDLFISALQKRGRFEGTSSKLLELLTPEKPPRGWPPNPRVVTQLLRRQAPVMRKAGWTVHDDDGKNKSHALVWEITPPANEKEGNSYSPTSPTRQVGEVASQARKESSKSHTTTQCKSCAGEGCDWCNN